MLNYYKILDVSATASAQEIKSAYRKRVKQLHPDLQPVADRMAFHQVIEAYRILSEPYSRRQYDLYWSLFSSISSPHPFDFNWPVEWASHLFNEWSPGKHIENLKNQIINRITGMITVDFLGIDTLKLPFFITLPTPKVDVEKSDQAPEWFSFGNRFFKFSVINNALLYYQQALEALRQNNIEKTEKLLSQCLRLQPKFVLAYLALGNTYRMSGDLVKAKQYYRKVQELDSKGVTSLIAARYLQSLV